MKRSILSLLMAGSISLLASAQPGPRQLTSIEVNPDRTVEFTVSAPDAGSVSLEIATGHYPLTKGKDGVWAVKTPPVAPGFHYYFMNIDGIRLPDPGSRMYHGFGHSVSGLEIPEEGTGWMDIREVSHGKVSLVNYYSAVSDSWMPLYVYTPAGYDASDKRYPVVYVQHGGGEDYSGWIFQGRAANILDNLIAEGKAVEMILVAADGNSKSFRAELLENVIPFVERNFRTAKGPENRAMCGLSMGGGQSFDIGLNSPDVFSSIGVFSSGMFGGIPSGKEFDAEATAPGIYSDTAVFNDRHDVFYISCGEDDGRLPYTQKAVAQMREHGVDVVFESFPGDHDWQPWRKSLHSFVQLIFK